MNEALVAYDDALEQGDPSRLSDDLLLALPAVVNDSDILTSPLSDAAQLNGVYPFPIWFLLIKHRFHLIRKN